MSFLSKRNQTTFLYVLLFFAGQGGMLGYLLDPAYAGMTCRVEPTWQGRVPAFG